MTPEQLRATRMLGDLLVTMLKDASSSGSPAANEAQEWLNAAPSEGMASLQRTCEQLAAASQTLPVASAGQQSLRTDRDWFLAIKSAQHSAGHDAYSLESEVSSLVEQCHDRLLTVSGSQRDDAHALDPLGLDDTDPSPSDNSPTF